MIEKVEEKLCVCGGVGGRKYTRVGEECKNAGKKLFLMWTGPAAVVCKFRRGPPGADEAISLDWSCCKYHQEIENPSMAMAKCHGPVNYSDEPAARNV